MKEASQEFKNRWNKTLFHWRNGQNQLISKKYKKIRTTPNYIEHLLILASLVIGCVSISAFASLAGIPIGITSSAVELKICAITAGIKKYKPIIKKTKKKHD